MSLEQWSYAGNVVAALAVVASLVFVGLQLWQNTRAVRASASQGHSQLYADINAHVIDSGEFARIWRLGLGDPGSLDADERTRFFAFASTVFRYYESSQVLWLQGQLDASHWHMITQQAADFANQPGIQAWWQTRRHWHSVQFREWLEALPKASPPPIYDAPGVKAPARKRR
jgi:hypothetical protein